MAMYETEGFCPSNAFTYYSENEKISSFWNRTKEILGDRIGYMVYSPHGFSQNGCYVVDCLMGAGYTIGIEIATVLRVMIPECKYAVIGRKILVTDVINPAQIPGLQFSSDEKLFGDNGLFIFEDSRYIVGVTDEGEEVHMYFFKR